MLKKHTSIKMVNKIRTRKKLVLWASSSHILLAPVHFLLVSHNDFVLRMTCLDPCPLGK